MTDLLTCRGGPAPGEYPVPSDGPPLTYRVPVSIDDERLRRFPSNRIHEARRAGRDRVLAIYRRHWYRDPDPGKPDCYDFDGFDDAPSAHVLR